MKFTYSDGYGNEYTVEIDVPYPKEKPVTYIIWRDEHEPVRWVVTVVNGTATDALDKYLRTVCDDCAGNWKVQANGSDRVSSYRATVKKDYEIKVVA